MEHTSNPDQNNSKMNSFARTPLTQITPSERKAENAKAKGVKRQNVTDNDNTGPEPGNNKKQRQDQASISVATSSSSMKDNTQPQGRGVHMAKKKAAEGKKNRTVADKKRSKGVQPRFNPRSNDKHAPYFGSGVSFKWSDNPHITKAKAKKDNPDPSLLKIKLKDTKGKTWNSAKFVKYAVIDWSDAKMIKDLNKWRSQFISRTLDKNNTEPKASRPRWSYIEMLYMSRLIKKAILTKGAKLSKSDWIVIAKRMNKRFEGTICKKGQETPDTLNAKRVLVKGDVLKKDHIIPHRTSNTMKNQASRWPQVVEMMHQAIEDAGSSSSSDNEGDATAGEGNKMKKRFDIAGSVSSMSVATVSDDEGDDEDCDGMETDDDDIEGEDDGDQEPNAQ